MIKKMKKHDIKYDMKDLNMNGKILLTACLTALFGLSGCALFQKAPSETGPDQVVADTQVCPNGVCETDPFINYTQTRADYEAYGELSERDIIISEAGAGNNLSAAVPPSIESEVIEYEEQIENAASQAEDGLTETVVTEVIEPASDVASVQNASEAQVANGAEPTGINQPIEVVSSATVQENNPSDVAENDTEGTETENALETENASSDENASQDEEDEEDPVRDWYAEEGQNLKALLTDWSAQSGWRLVWNTNRNYVLNAGAMFRGRFADVSSALIRAFARARPAPIATFYKGNRVLVVETMEDENAYD